MSEKKKCKHTKTMYDKKTGRYKCMFCPKILDEFRHGVKKKGRPVKPLKIDPRVEEAEKLKRAMTGINVKLKGRYVSADTKKALRAEKSRIEAKMKKLQESLDSQ
jgi:hypothetical protein